MNGSAEAVVEIKTSPKKRDLAHVIALREKYEALGVSYFLVGGYVSLHRQELIAFRTRDWACFTGVVLGTETYFPNFLRSTRSCETLPRGLGLLTAAADEGPPSGSLQSSSVRGAARL